MPLAPVQEKPPIQSDGSAQRTWRPRLPPRLSVRGLMVVVLLLSGALGWVVNLAHVQRDAVAAIRADGGQVRYDWELMRLPNGKIQRNPTGRPRGPKWLVDYLGFDYVSHVEQVDLGPRNRDEVIKHVRQLNRLRQLRFSMQTIGFDQIARAGMESLPNNGVSVLKGFMGLLTVDLVCPEFKGANFKYLKDMTRLEILNLPSNTSATNSDLTYLRRLTALSELDLGDPRITDDGLVSLEGMTRMTRLNLAGTQVTGAGLRSLRGMPGLKILNVTGTRVHDLSSIGHLTLVTRLDLWHTPIDDKGLAPIVGMSGLNNVDLTGTQITSDSYAYLKRLRKLDNLSLANTRVGDEGSAALGELTALTRLNLDDTQITDITVASLSKLPKLKSLSLAGSGLTDRGLATLIECKTLRQLNVRRTKIGRDGYSAFRKARPRLSVEP